MTFCLWHCVWFIILVLFRQSALGGKKWAVPRFLGQATRLKSDRDLAKQNFFENRKESVELYITVRDEILPRMNCAWLILHCMITITWLHFSDDFSNWNKQFCGDGHINLWPYCANSLPRFNLVKSCNKCLIHSHNIFIYFDVYYFISLFCILTIWNKQ